MKKYPFAALLLLPLLAACHQNSYKITGTTEGLSEGDTLYLLKDINTGLPSDTLVVREGGFSCKGTVDSAAIALLYAQKKPETSTTLLLEPGTIKVHLTDDPTKTRIGGTDANEALQEANLIAYMYGEKMKEIVQTFSTDPVSTQSGLIAKAQLERLKSDMTHKILDIAEQNIDNEFGFLIIAHLDDDDSTIVAKRNLLKEKMPEAFRKRME